ncbi:hypothetical protein BD413DRAFT_517972 [Trametes elegans]|nr:hypothetical protein BD413DRAFT_517972 [Trametes elegans]
MKSAFLFNSYSPVVNVSLILDLGTGVHTRQRCAVTWLLTSHTSTGLISSSTVLLMVTRPHDLRCARIHGMWRQCPCPYTVEAVLPVHLLGRSPLQSHC